jgi:two-component system, response regulator PdtaR
VTSAHVIGTPGVAGGYVIMECFRVLIVEDDCLIAADVEAALTERGHTVCGVAATQIDAIRLASLRQPDCAIVDIALAPGDGRLVARALAERGVAVLFAAGDCADVDGLSHTGALGCLPKPYSAGSVPAALAAICRRRAGETPADLPANMFLLDAA